MKEKKNNFYRFPSIEQFRTVIKQVNHVVRYRGEDDNGDPIYDTTDGILPTLEFMGTVKLHGTNAGIVFQWDMLQHDYVMHAQSRGNVITPIKDNMGFAAFAHTAGAEQILNLIEKELGDDLGYTPEVVRVYGEWCGGNIQKGVGISGLDKMFVIFAIKVDKTWLTNDKLVNIKNTDNRIYNILDYPVSTIEIDFNDPSASTDKLAELTDVIEKECPVGKAFFNDVMIKNVAYEENGKIWFDKENRFTDEFKSILKPKFEKLRLETPIGKIFIKFSLES